MRSLCFGSLTDALEFNAGFVFVTIGVVKTFLSGLFSYRTQALFYQTF